MVDAMISVLFVDDEPELLQLTQIFLERTGEFRVATSTSAQKSLDSGAIPSYDAIVSDYQMPGMDGIAFLKEVRERFGEIPFILFTGRGREEIVIEAINNGVDFYLQKGGDARAQFAELSTKIQYAVSRRRTEAELQKKNEELNVSYEKIAAAEEELRQQLDELTIKQETLKNSEEKFRAFTENIPDLTTIVDMTGSYTYISPSIERITGQSGDELLGKKFAEIDGAFGILPEDKEILLKSGRTAVQKPGENIPVPPFRIRNFKGNILSIEGVNTYLPGVKGIQGILFHGREISDRIQAEAALRESEEKYRTLIEVAKEGVIIVQDWRLVFANRHIANFLGVPVEKLAGTPFIDYIWPDDREIIREYYRKWIAGKEIPDECDFRIIGSGSRPAWVFLSSAEITWQGRPATLHLLTDITERKFAEDLARESEETFRKVIEGAPDAIYIRAEGKFVYLNPAALRLFGVSSGEQLVGTPFLDRIHTKHHEKIKKRICEPDDNPDPAQPLEGVYLRLDGTEVDVEVSRVSFRYLGRDSELVFVRDITDRKRADQEIQQARDTVRTFLDHSYDAVFISDLNGRVLDVNATTLGMYRVTREEALALTIDDFTGPDTRMCLEKSQEIWREVLSGKEHLFPWQARRPKDGSLFDVEVYLTRIEMENQPIVLANVRDVTDRKRAEVALRESGEKYRLILEHMQDAYLRVDRDGKITMANPAAARMYGYPSPDEVVGTPVADLYMDPGLRMELLQRLNLGKIADTTVMMVRRDGTTFWVSLNIHFLIGEDGSTAGTEEIIRDITERKSMEQAIQEANRKLNLLNSITRHDVVNQLTVLNGYVRLAEMKSPDPVIADFLCKIEATADTISRQIAFTKTYQELGVRTPAWFRLDETVTKTERADVTLSGTCRSIEILADPMLERVFFNIFENVTRHGGKATRITVRCERAPDGLVIIIEDDGAGIAPELKEKIFEKGYGKNTGFGLFLAREILAITGITIRETGYLGIGARFEITVPKEIWRIAAGQ